jgi:hypothetical protein
MTLDLGETYESEVVHAIDRACNQATKVRLADSKDFAQELLRLALSEVKSAAYEIACLKSTASLKPIRDFKARMSKAQAAMDKAVAEYTKAKAICLLIGA